MHYALLLLAVMAGYLLGSIPFGYLIGRLHRVDIRRFGSGATGGTNVLRTLGALPALATAAGDVGKAMMAAWLGGRLGGEWGYVLATLAAMLGHSYPVWLGWRGGKAVAPAAGGVILRYPAAIGYGFAVGMCFLVPTRYVSLGSMTAAATVAAYLLLTQPLPGQILGVGAAAIVIWRHRENIDRLLKGKENKFGQKAGPRG